jgi:hypothetical protein
MPDRKDQLLETIRQTVGVQTAEFQSAHAELGKTNAQAYLENLQKTREVLAAMDSEI